MASFEVTTEGGFPAAIVEYVIRWKEWRALANEPASARKLGAVTFRRLKNLE
jgi:hypothetical protein